MELPANTPTEFSGTKRFSTILADLCKNVPTQPQGLAGGADSLAAPMRNTSKPRSTLPDELVFSRVEITIGEIIDRTRHAGFGFVAAMLAIISIPLVGFTAPLGLAIASVGVQMIAGRPQPWLPRFIRRRSVPIATLESLSRRMTCWTARLERVIRPRFSWLMAGPFWTVCGASLVVQGLALSLPIPGADWLFVVPIVLYGIGLLESDGLLIMVCHAVTLVQVVLGAALWNTIARGFADAYGWFAKWLG
jgi:hypothetical protein